MAEDPISITQQILRRTVPWKCFPQLLHYPLGVRAARYVEVQDPAPAVFNHEEAIQELEGECGHGEEVDGHDCLVMIRKEGEPAFAWIAAASDASQIPGYSALGDLEAKLSAGRLVVGTASASTGESPRDAIGRPCLAEQ